MIWKVGSQPPSGYVDHTEWAEVQLKAGLKQKQCKSCKLWLFPQEKKVHKCGGKESRVRKTAA